jgi:DNA-binding transcriptional MerR regulator
MADSVETTNEVLHPIEPSELLEGLRLTTGKAAQFAGVSRRQLCYWTDTGIVSAIDGDGDGSEDDSARRSYDFEALHRVLLIQQALERSSGLRRAAREVDQYLGDQKRRAAGLAASIEQKREEFLTEQADRLEALAGRVQQLLPKRSERGDVLELLGALDWLERITERVQSGEVLLEEDPETCVRLASLIEQAEAKLDNGTSAD